MKLMKNNWRIEKLGDICQFQYGKSLTEKYRNEGSIPVFGSAGIIGWHDTPLTQSDTLIIGRKGSVGNVFYSKIPCYPIDTTYYVDSLNTEVNLQWIYLFLIKTDLSRLNMATAVPGLNRHVAYELLIPIPSPSEQQRIVALFQSIDKSILLTEQQGNNLKQLWLKLLNIFVSDKPKFGDLLCGEELNEYQYKDFSEKIVRKIDPIALGVERRIGGEDFSSSELKLRSWGIVGKDYLGPAFYQHVLPRDILYVSRNAHLRKVAFADFEGVCSNTTFVIRAKETIILQDLLKHIMLSEKFSQYAMSVSKGSTNPYLNWKDLNNFTVKLPELDKQRKIADLLDEVLLARETVLEQKRNLQILKQKLLNDVLG